MAVHGLFCDRVPGRVEGWNRKQWLNLESHYGGWLTRETSIYANALLCVSMSELMRADSGAVMSRRYDYAEGTVLVADLGPGDATAEVVDGTVLVNSEAGQREFEMPRAASARINNGVLTVEVTDREAVSVELEGEE